VQGGERYVNVRGDDKQARTVLPIPDRSYTGLVTYDAKDPDTRFPPIQQLRPPKGAPNVLVILLDDVGFAASSAFGGPCHTPTAERLARGGLKYNCFHTTALCSPTRQALLTGRNHHAVGMGGITELATSAPGYNSIRPDSAAPLAETLRLNGYSTAQFGKCHEVPVWETSPMGPFRQWPTGSGFEHFYGFIGGETNQYAPSIYRDTVPVEPSRTAEEGYHFTEDMTDQAIGWIRQQKALMPDKPFFVYFAPGATHAPHHVPKEWADKYKGKFDQGWDKLREEIFARERKLGVVPTECQLTERPKEIPGWEDMPKDLRPVLARQMEIYAGFLEHTDQQVGWLIDTLEELKILDDTIIFYILGDNGASAEGTINGTFNEMLTLNGASALESVEFMASRIDQFGSPEAYNHYAVGWAHAMDTPYQWTKQVASHWGGTRNGTIVHWPKGFKAKGQVRSQFHHVIDVAPTILEAAGLPEPAIVHGIIQMPLQGTSMAYSFDVPDAPDRHETQYFEMFVNRGIYHKGWTAVTRHSTPWLVGAKLPAIDDDVWELYDTATDWSQAHDLAGKHPEILKELQRLWLIEAVKYNVLPLDDRRVERFNSDLAGRPELIKGRSQTLFAGMGRLQENTVLNVKNKSFSVTAEIEVANAAEGVILGQGGRFGGWALYAKAGKAKFVYNLFGIQRWHVEAEKPIPKGKHEVRMEFAYGATVAAAASGQGGKQQQINPLGQGGNVTLYYDGQKVGEGRVDRTVPFAFSGDETTDVGRATATSPTDDYDIKASVLNGKINVVRIDLGDEKFHVAHEDRLRIAMAKQ
jgi:arylsulfatase A-like enzyme